MTSSRIHWIAALALGFGTFAGCGGEAVEPVARLAVEPMEITLPYGTFAELGFSWSLLREPEGASGTPRVFLHLLDNDGNLARTFDHDLPGEWRTGDERSYRNRVYQSLLAPPLPPGSYTLTAGLYDAEGNRWPLAFEGGGTDRYEYRVATVEIPAGGPDPPAIRFSPSWSPTLAGADRQVVAFRWLSGSGAIHLEETADGGTLWLALRVPGAQAGDMRRRMVEPSEGGDGVPGVGVAADCGAFQSQVSGEGLHGLDVSIPAGSDGCGVTLEPNYVMESVAGEARSVVLEVLAWRPGRA